MHRLLAAAATVTLIAGGAVAQTATDTATPETAAGTDMAATQTNEMTFQDVHGNLSAMRDLVSAELARMGIAADTDQMTIGQLAELALVLDDDSLQENDRIDQARQIVEN